MSSDKGIIKKLKLHELVGYSSDDNIDVYPITSIAAVYDENNKSLADILKDIQANGGGGSNPKSRLLQIYKTANIQPSIPVGGTYDFDNNTFTPPTGWVADSNGLTNPIWMSMGSVLSNSEGIVWSVPICIAGATEITTLKRCYVAIIYKNSDTQPETPSGGSCDFSSGSPIFSPPDGWSINSEIPVNENTWCSIRAFYSDNTETQWSVPSKVAQANVSLTAAQLDVIAGKITITANNLDYIASHITLNTESLDYIAKNMTFTADQIRMIANNVDVLGTLNTRDLTINGDKSKFNADGSGQVANGNVSWDPEGNLILKGNIQADYLKYTTKVLYPTTDNNIFTLDPIKDRCSMYIVAYDYDKNSTTAIINSTKLILSDNVEQGITFKIGLICNGNFLQVWSSLSSVPLTSKGNSYIMGEGYKSTSTTAVTDFASNKIELGFNTIYEFTYLGYNVWALNGKCRAYE